MQIKTLNTIVLLLLSNWFNCAFGAEEKADSLVYQLTFDSKNVTPEKILEQIILLADSTYIIRSFSGPLDGSFDDYNKWTKSEWKGSWKVNGSTLTLIRGDELKQYKINKKRIKLKRLQKASMGWTWSYRKWAFERRSKYKRLKS